VQGSRCGRRLLTYAPSQLPQSRLTALQQYAIRWQRYDSVTRSGRVAMRERRREGQSCALKPPGRMIQRSVAVAQLVSCAKANSPEQPVRGAAGSGGRFRGPIGRDGQTRDECRNGQEASLQNPDSSSRIAAPRLPYGRPQH
jgi:hypothetical protein